MRWLMNAVCHHSAHAIIMADHHQLPPPFACSNCVTERAIVFCFADGARLCLHCDAALHGASPLASLHRRAPLCDACDAAPAALRCQVGAHLAALCADCADHLAPPDGGASLVEEYTGCPTPAEILRVLSVEAPSSQDDFDAWLADVLPQFLQEIQWLNSVVSAAPAMYRSKGNDIEKRE
ncbi:hypothetical protein CFC21_067123 [Triticum aestivum]|uniref:B box-type domain-containing protein n=2 Tax=Triticum aestivum TaxID=4565 RepID=A0A9R1KN89_WHEAT|nr:putative zinc finger protein CONSTANS-LIKE 11 [Triticum aestivum]KAF7060324.1 hypothetical protein CFC21_067120 [Triticum aestivum]KAF7060327.1 hypothetical protein CFC21_067123 [Triticum aestivum]